MRLWVSMHVSDHSGFHYRQFLLKALVRELSQSQSPSQQTQSPASSPLLPSSSSPPPPPQRSPADSPPQSNGEASTTATAPEAHGAPTTFSQLLHDEMELCTDLIESYPGHETLWCHR